MRQDGSTKVFVVVGIVLTLIAVGVLYGSKHLAMNGPTPPMSMPEPIKEQSAEKTEQKSVDKSTDEKSKNAQKEAEKRPVSTKEATKDEKKDKATKKPEKPASIEVAKNEEKATSQPVPRTKKDDLPQTGPAENLSAIVLALVVASGVGYYRSLRRV